MTDKFGGGKKGTSQDVPFLRFSCTESEILPQGTQRGNAATED
jgi:hypothetical protein